MNDDDHEAYGAMVFRGLQEQRAGTKMTEDAMIQRAAIAMMEQLEWGLGDLRTAKRMARVALEAVAPLDDMLKLFEAVDRRNNLKSFDEIWPIANGD